MINLKEHVQSPDDVMPVTAMCLMQPRGSTLIVGTETGYLATFALTSGQFQFKQVLRNDLQAPVHSICSISKNLIAVGFKNTIQILSILRPNMPEVVHNVPEGGSVVGLACNDKIMAIAIDTQGVIFYDLIQNLEVSN